MSRDLKKTFFVKGKMLLFLCERYVNTKQNRLEDYSKRFPCGAGNMT